MKILLFFALLGTASMVNAQSLKDALYSGKLRLDTGTVIRKGDDLTSRIDTSTRKPAPIVKAGDTTATSVAMGGANPGTTVVLVDSLVYSKDSATGAVSTTLISVPVRAALPRDNNAVWKDYIDSIKTVLNSEVLTSKKIKNGGYSVLIEYEIGLDGQVTINSVSSAPQNSYLEQQVNERLTLTVPTLTPLIGTTGKPRVAKKKQTLALTKL